MRFRQLDQITELQPGQTITAVKRLRPDEEYLRDHFPCFPVMPGVLMLEALYQASHWLVRSTEDFAHSMVMLKEAKAVKFADFVGPGQVLTVTAKILKQDESTTTLNAKGMVDDSVAVSGRLILERFDLADDDPTYAGADATTKRRLRTEFERLTNHSE